MGPQGYNLAYPADYRNQQALARLEQFQRAFEVRTPLCTASTLFSWNAVDVTPTMAREIKQAVKAKHEEAAWLKVAQAIPTELREQQRAALTAHLLAHPHLLRPTLRSGAQGAFVRELQQRLKTPSPARWPGPHRRLQPTVTAVNALRLANGLPQDGIANSAVWEILLRGLRSADSTRLYEYLLIDPEMSACMMTSRIKQAISSVQLFVQRCFLNLEPHVHLLPGDAEEWKWKKAYRVWEANRKIFLYPETGSNPSSRDGKSPFYVDLETELLQGEVTDQAVEDAFDRYAELHDVAHLEVAGVYHQAERDERGSIETHLLHVVARTRTSPHVHYYRQRVDGSYWTPWQKIDLDIVGDHLVPVVYNRVLHLMWAVFQEKPDEDAISPTAAAPGTSRQALGNLHARLELPPQRQVDGQETVPFHPLPATDLPTFNLPVAIITSAPSSMRPPATSSSVAYRTTSTPIVGDFRLLACSGEVIVQNLTRPEPGCPLHLCSGRPPTPPRGSWDSSRTPSADDRSNCGSGRSRRKPITRNCPTTPAASNSSSRPLAESVSRSWSRTRTASSCPERPFFYQDRDRAYFVIPRTLRVPVRNPDRDLGLTVNLGSTISRPWCVSDFVVTPHMVDVIAFQPQGAYPSGLPITPSGPAANRTVAEPSNPNLRTNPGAPRRVRGANPTARREATGVTSQARSTKCSPAA